jgi:transposase-like protein
MISEDMPLRAPRDRLSEAEIKLLFTLWFSGVTARRATVATPWARHTVTRYFRRFREGAASGAAASAAAAPLAVTVECDESYFGGDPYKSSFEPPKDGEKKKRGRGSNKIKVFGMVERSPVDAQGKPLKGSEPKRVVPVVVANVRKTTLQPLIEKYVDKACDLMTDDFKSYKGLEDKGFNHFPVNHSAGEWKEAWTGAHTNTIESVWCHFKDHLRRFKGGWQQKAQLWLNECAARWQWRTFAGLKSAVVRGLGILRKSARGL